MDNRQEREERRRQVCRQFLESGLTRKAFCEKHGVGLSTLGFWLQKERAEKQTLTDGKMVAVGSVKPSELRQILRIRVREHIVIELDLPATEQDIRTVLRSVTDL